MIPGDLLGLLRFTMNATDVYFKAVNKKGRRWIPAPEAQNLCQMCHNICDARQFNYLTFCSTHSANAFVNVPTVHTTGRIQCSCAVVCGEGLEAFQKKTKTAHSTGNFVPWTLSCCLDASIRRAKNMHETVQSKEKQGFGCWIKSKEGPPWS